MSQHPADDSTDDPGALGRLSDDEVEAEESSTTDGTAAEGAHDPAQGSPPGAHPTGETFPDEVTRYDDPEHRRT